MRVWLQKQKKKEETKAAAKAVTPPVENTPAAAEVQPVGDAAEKPVDSVEATPQAEGVSGEEAAVGNAGEAEQRAGSAALQPKEVGLHLFALHLHLNTRDTVKGKKELGVGPDCLARMNTIDAERASDHGVLLTSSCAVADQYQTSAVLQPDETERRGSVASQSVAKDAAPSTNDAQANDQINDGPADGTTSANSTMMNGISGQMGYGNNQAGFNNMGWNGMNGMSNMMGNGTWNGMNPMGKILLATSYTIPANVGRLQQYEQHDRHVRQFWWKHGHGHERHVSHELWWQLWRIQWHGWWLWQLQRTQLDGWI
jgi:hypothetical protein